MNDDPEIVLKLPLSAVQTVMQHLGVGVFNTVFAVMNSIAEQATPQMNLAALAQAKPSAVTDEPATVAANERLN